MGRSKWPMKFAEALSNLETYGSSDMSLAPSIIKRWLIESLERAERTTYYFIEIQMKTEPVTAADVAYAYHYKINYASSLLKSLWSLGLLTREQVRDEHGQHYEYRLAL
jgi:hypothetical protein